MTTIATTKDAMATARTRMEKAVVLLSGGVGSLVAAAIAREQYELALLHVRWGHRSAERELACCQQLAAWLRCEQVRTAVTSTSLGPENGIRKRESPSVTPSVTRLGGSKVRGEYPLVSPHRQSEKRSEC